MKTFISTVFLLSSFGLQAGIPLVYDEIKLLSQQEAEALTKQVSRLPGNAQVRLVADFEGRDPYDLASEVYKEVLYSGNPGDNGFLLIYGKRENTFQLYNGSSWTHKIEKEEKEDIIKNILTPAFAEEDYITGLLDAIESVEDIFSGNNTFPMSEKMMNSRQQFVDETQTFSLETWNNITELLNDEDVTQEEHILRIRVTNLDLSGYNVSSEQGKEIRREYASQLYHIIFKNRIGAAHTNDKEIKLTLLCVVNGEVHFITNWEKDLEYTYDDDGKHREVSTYLDWVYDDYKENEEEQDGLLRMTELIIELSRGEIEAKKSDFVSYGLPIGMVFFIFLLVMLPGGAIVFFKRKTKSKSSKTST